MSEELVEKVKRAIEEVGMAGHIIEKEVLFKILEAIKDVKADLTNINIHIPSLKRGVNKQLSSEMTFTLVGYNRAAKIIAFNRIVEVADETGCAITSVTRE